MLALCTALGCGGDDGAATADDDPPPSKDAGTGKADAKVNSVPDTGVKPVPDSGTGKPSTNPALDALAGRYLLRFDTFGTASTVVSIRSRVSLLFVTELVVDGDKLKATERLCNQTAKQKCLDKTCGSATTVVDPRVIENFLHKTQFAREYTLSSDGKTIQAGESIEPLGYDGDGPLPTSSSDKSVWDVDPSQGPREGMLTKLTVNKVPPFNSTITCDVYGVQKFVNHFDGTLGGTSSAPTFPATMDLIFTEGTVAGRLGSTNPAVCDAAGDSPLDKATVELVRYGADDGDKFWDCYADSVFEDKLPATPDSIIDAP